MSSLNLNKILFIVIILMTLLMAQACFELRSPVPPEAVKAEPILDLSGSWKFTIGDDMNWKNVNYDASDWEEINVPASWENQGFHGYNGFAWYRKSFNFPQNLSTRNLYLHLGYVDDVDEVYLNGHLIGVSGGFPPNYQTAYNAFRRYPVSPDLINKDGSNLIAVRVYDAELEGGILSGNIGLYKSQDELYPDFILSGKWKFNTGDKPEWSENSFDDSEWNDIFVPAHWESQGFKGYDGFAWYRKNFTLSADYKGEKFVLLLGKIDDIDQVFINGKFVGSTGVWNFDVTPSEFNRNNEYLELRTYFIPEGVIKFSEENTIAVRVYDGFMDGGIYEGPVGLITQQNYRDYWKNKQE